MNHRSLASSVVKSAYTILWLALIAGLLYLADSFGYQLHDLGAALMGVVVFPLKMYEVRDYYEEGACDWCGSPLYKGDSSWQDDFHMFCCVDCGRQYNEKVKEVI